MSNPLANINGDAQTTFADITLLLANFGRDASALNLADGKGAWVGGVSTATRPFPFKAACHYSDPFCEGIPPDDGDGGGCMNSDCDNDGAPNDQDNCPSTPNPDQADSDCDGAGDACDPGPPMDSDGDGVSDMCDNCPTTPNADQADCNGDGEGDACDSTPGVAVTIANPPSCIGIWAPNDQDSDDTNDTDDLPTLTASGSDPAGTYTRSVVEGVGRIVFVDADPDDSLAAGQCPVVRLRGIAPSAALNDVIIEVTHTTADGSCMESDMIELTVILATLTFRPANPQSVPRETWSANNEVNAGLFGVFGAPTLGFVSPGNPPGAVGFLKGMEIRAQIQPCVAGITCIFDIKRVRQGIFGLIVTNRALNYSEGEADSLGLRG